jgi:hypothetical protein
MTYLAHSLKHCDVLCLGRGGQVRNPGSFLQLASESQIATDGDEILILIQSPNLHLSLSYDQPEFDEYWHSSLKHARCRGMRLLIEASH